MAKKTLSRKQLRRQYGLSKPAARQLAATLAANAGVRELAEAQTAGLPAKGNGLRKLLLDAGADPAKVAMMMDPGVDPELRQLFVAQHIPGVSSAVATPAPTAQVDEQRRLLDHNARQLAQARCKSNPKVDEGEAYILAVEELMDAQALDHNARQLAQARRRVDPQLDPDKTYALAREELAKEHQFARTFEG
jgi:hypothetical protein